MSKKSKVSIALLTILLKSGVVVFCVSLSKNWNYGT